MPKEIPKRVFAVVMSSVAIAGIAGSQIGQYLTNLAAPYLVFGLLAART